MSDQNNRNQRNAALTGAATLTAALAAGLAFEHMHAQSNDRESVVQGIRRWFSDTVSDVTGTPSSTQPRGHYGGSSDRRRGGGGGSSSSVPAGVHAPSAAEVASYARRRLSPSEIEALPVRVVTDVDVVDGAVAVENNGTTREKAFCVVCREHYANGDRLMRLPCFHEFHCECIRDYLESTDGPLCPVCRHPVMFS